MATLIRLIVSPKELRPVPIKYFSLCLLNDNLFSKFIFSLIDKSWAWPVLPKIAAPWQPLSIIVSAWLMVLSIFKLRSLFKTETVAA